jgi:two-component system, OmpR family, alkaline phosphatase synthesis response regulator PhoP
MARILIVEDHAAIAAGLRSNLELERHETLVAGDGVAAIQQVAAWDPELVILDLMLPKLDGFEVLARIRAAGSRCAVLVLSARGGEPEKVRALRLGADDYVVKPFGLMELLARVQALLRRAHPEAAPPLDPPRYRFGDVEVDAAARQTLRAGTAVSLRPREFDLLLALLRARGAVVSRKDLLVRVWGYEPSVVTRTVDTHIATLRSRLEANPDHPHYILTVWKAGYRIAIPEATAPPG